MDAYMLVEVPALREALLAVLACEGLLAGVDEEVTLELVLLGEENFALGKIFVRINGRTQKYV
eukprot:856730-Amorphochlora_amoeboformis.AAC.1